METTNGIEFVFLVTQKNANSEWNGLWFSYVVGLFRRFVWWTQEHKPCMCLEKQINMIRNFTDSQECSHLHAHLAQRIWCQLNWLTAKWRVDCDYICSTGSVVSTPSRQCSFGPWAKKGREPRSWAQELTWCSLKPYAVRHLAWRTGRKSNWHLFTSFERDWMCEQAEFEDLH